MSDNPYATPETISQDSVTPDLDSRPGQRPPGVTLLSVLLCLGGIMMLLLLFQQMVMGDPEVIATVMGLVGVPVWLLIVAMLLLAVVPIGAAVGMWTRTKWGWWLGAFYFMYAVFRNGSALGNVIHLADELENTPRGASYYMFKYGMRVLISSLVFLYFFKDNVLRYFGLETISKPQAVAVIVVICVSLTLVVMAITFVTP